MANTLLNNAPNILGLLGLRPRRTNSLLPFADAADEAMFAANPNGTIFSQPQAQPAPQAPMQAQAQPQRERVSGWRLLDRVLGGETITGGLDAERARLTQEAQRPAQQARIQAVLSQIADPREQALFLGLGGEDWQKNVGQQFAPQVVAEGAAQRVAGTGDVYNNRRTREFGDSLVRDTDTGFETLGTRGPTIAEQTAQDRLAWDQQYGQGRLDVDRGQLGVSQQNADTTAASAGFSLSPGQTRFGAGGAPIATVSPSTATDTPAAREARATALTGTAGNISTALGRARSLASSAGTWQQYNPLARQDRVDLDSSLNTIKANLTFDKLNELKSASPTGASGLGALSNQEGILLASTVAALSPDMSPGELEASFKIIDDLVAKMNQSATSLRTGGGNSSAPPLPPGFVLD